jgi:hypothetical protein
MAPPATPQQKAHASHFFRPIDAGVHSYGQLRDMFAHTGALTGVPANRPVYHAQVNEMMD